MSDNRSIQEKRELLKKLMAEKKVKAQAALTATEVVEPATNEVDPSFYDVSKFPEIVGHHAQFEQLGQLKIENPYFRVNETIVNNRTQILGRDMISSSSYNYLGMTGDQRVSNASKEAIDKYGTSVSSSRVATGEKPIHQELESEIAGLLDVEAAVVMVGGHSTNVTTIGHLMRPQDLIVFDELSHNSILQGAELSGARRMPFPHEDFEALDKILTEHRGQYQRVLITIEGVYSMDGDIANLPEFIKLRNKHKCLLMVDEAHSMGVLGKNSGGIRDHFGVAGDQVDLWMSTFSKSFASCGGYIAGKKSMIEYLKYTAPGFLYSVGIPASNAAAALAAMRVFQEEPWRSEKLRKNADFFVTKAKSKGLDTGISNGTAVVPIIIRNSAHALVLGHRLFEDNINVQPILAPAVADSESRLRFFITCDHTEEEMAHTIERVAHHLNLIKTEFN